MTSNFLVFGPVYFFAVLVILLIGVTLVTFGRFNTLERLFEWRTSRPDTVYRLRENVSFTRPVVNRAKKRSALFRADDDTVPVTIVDYLRVGSDLDESTMSKSYGVSIVDAARTMRMGYTRALKRLRQSSIVIGDDTKNETKCDQWMSASDQTTLMSHLKKCNVNEGSQACFHCVESRKFVRECVHMSKPLTTVNQQNLSLVIPANNEMDEGWCLPSSFRDVSFVDGKPIPIDTGTSQRNCNPNTGDWLLVRVDNSFANVDSSYNWICRCRYPSLMTNLYDLTTDCAKPVGCQPNGELDEDSRKGRVDPYANGRCLCNDRYKSSFDNTIGPICVSKTILDYGLENLNYPSMVDYLPISSISLEMLSLLVNVETKDIKLPNPCHFDAFWKNKLTDAECQLIEYTSKSERIAFCVSRSENYVAFRRRSDYLLNNHGKHPNACVYVGARDILDEDKRQFNERPPSNHREYIDHAFNLSYYNGRALPDVGLLVYRHRRVQKLYDLVINDRNYIDWYAHNCRDIDPSVRADLRFELSKIFLSKPLVVYNVFPDVKSVTVVDVRSFFTLYDLAINPDERLQKIMIVSDDKEQKHIHPFKYYGTVDNVYLILDPKVYNTYLPKFPEQAINCNGYGAVEGDQPVYLEYFDQNADPKQMRKYGVQWFLRDEVEAMRFYPALQSIDKCGQFCMHGSPIGTLDDAYNKEYPKLWPVVVHGNRKFAPNVLHKHFDATVQIVITNNFYVLMTNGYSSDFLDHKQSKNRSVFELRPKGFIDFT